jgi:hypothetical protein
MPPGVSLSKLGLVAVDGLECPEGGLHHVLEPELVIAAAEGQGAPRCQRCGQTVELRAAVEP